jgi:hypothetical protein
MFKLIWCWLVSIATSRRFVITWSADLKIPVTQMKSIRPVRRCGKNVVKCLDSKILGSLPVFGRPFEFLAPSMIEPLRATS